MSTTIQLLGRTYKVSPPAGSAGFTAAEEWVTTAQTISEGQGLRLLGASIGITTALGRESGETLLKHGFNMLSYGGAVYGWLRQAGVSQADLVPCMAPCSQAIASVVAPKEQEVKDQVDFSSDGEPST